MNTVDTSAGSCAVLDELRLPISRWRFCLWNLPFFVFGYAVAAALLWWLDEHAGAYLGWALALSCMAYALYVGTLHPSRYEVLITADSVTAPATPHARARHSVRAPLAWTWTSTWHTWPFKTLEIQGAQGRVQVPSVLFAPEDMDRLLQALERMRAA